MTYEPVPSSPSSSGWNRWIERLRAVTAGRFTIIRELGRGGFAAVFLAQQLKPSRRVAIKLLLPSHLESQWALDHFRGESQKIAEWRHQSVVTIYEVHEIEDLFFFVMSYVEGGSLHDLIQLLGPLSIPMTLSVLAQTGSALQYAHRQGVTHRDIKPQNVLIDTDGGAVVTDFGISKQAGGTSHTVTGMIFGTPPYMAPEQCESGATSIASDQYALGIMAYEMLTGAPPFTGAPMSVLIAHLQDDVPMLRTVRPDTPPALEAAVARMLAKKPEDRFPSVGEAMQAAGALELPDYNPERLKFAAAARQVAARMSAPVLDLQSIPPQIEVGDRISIEANARTITGEAITAGSIEWSVDNTKIAQVDRANGTLTALEPGKATLLVRSGGTEQQVIVDVIPAQVASIQVAAPTGPLRVGDRAQLTASARSKHGVPIATIAKWTTDNPALATISAEGMLQTHGAGRTLVRAQVDQITSEFWLEVAAPKVSEVRITGSLGALTVGDKRQLSAVVLDTSDHVLTDRMVGWQSSDRTVATVSSSGLVTASAAGAVTITATVDEQKATLTLTVEAPLAAHVELQGAPGSINVGDRVRLRAVARDAQGNTVDKPTTWTSDDPAIARVEADGTLMGVHAGNVRVSATVDGVTAATELDVVRQVTARVAPPPANAREAATVIDAPAYKPPPAPAAAPTPPAPAPAAKPPAAPVPAVSRLPKKSGSSRGLVFGIGGVLVAAVIVYAATRGGSSPTPPETTPPAGGAGASAPPSASAPVTSPATNPASALVTPPATQSAPPPRQTPKPPPSSTTGAGAGAPTGAAGAVARGANPPPRTLTLSAPTSTLVAGDSVALRVSVSDGSAPTGMRWISDDPTKAIVSRTGVVRAVAAGSVTIVALSGSMSDSVVLTVRPRPVTSTAAPPVVAPPRDSTPPPTTAPASSNDAAAERPVRQAITDYATALSVRKINDVLRVYPKMPKDIQNGWKALFDFAKDLQVTYNVDNVDIIKDAATARVSGLQSYTNPDTKRKCRVSAQFVMKLSQAAGTWHITDVAQIGRPPDC
jgi:serine/threonine-protein kinase